MSVFVNQVGLDAIVTISNQGDASVADTIAGLDGQLDVANPVTVAGVGATNTAYYGERQQFTWTSLAASFSFTAAAADPIGDTCITDWDGMTSDIIPDPDVNTGAVTWGGEDAEFTIGAVIAGLLIVNVLADIDNTGGGAAEWDFSLLRNGVKVAASHRTEWTALNNRIDTRILFEIVLAAAGDTFCITGQPTAGSETLIIRKWVPQFTPVRQA